MIYIPYPRVNCLKTIPFTAAHTYIAHIWQYPPGKGITFVVKKAWLTCANRLFISSYITASPKLAPFFSKQGFMGDDFRVSAPAVRIYILLLGSICLVLISSNLEQLLVTVLSLRTDFSNQVTVRVVCICKLVFFSCNRGAIIQ